MSDSQKDEAEIKALEVNNMLTEPDLTDDVAVWY